MLPKPPSTATPFGRWLYSLWDHIKGMSIGDSQDIKWHRSPSGITGTVRVLGGGGGRTIQRFKVMTIEASWIVCRKVDEDGVETGTDEFKVLRPKMLRTDHALLVGFTSTPALTSAQSRSYDITRGTTPPNFTITEIIHPPYTAGDFIYGANDIRGGTIDDGTGEQVKWIDLNIDARRWQLELQRVGTCVNDVAKLALAQISESENVP